MRKISKYRKLLSVNLPKLAYLDDWPIWEIDRIGADAFREGGEEAEKKAREDYLTSKEQTKASIMQNAKRWEAVGTWL